MKHRLISWNKLSLTVRNSAICGNRCTNNLNVPDGVMEFETLSERLQKLFSRDVSTRNFFTGKQGLRQDERRCTKKQSLWWSCNVMTLLLKFSQNAQANVCDGPYFNESRKLCCRSFLVNFTKVLKLLFCLTHEKASCFWQQIMSRFYRTEFEFALRKWPVEHESVLLCKVNATHGSGITHQLCYRNLVKILFGIVL